MCASMIVASTVFQNALHIQENREIRPTRRASGPPKATEGPTCGSCKPSPVLQRQEGEYKPPARPLGVYYEFDTMALTREIPIGSPLRSGTQLCGDSRAISILTSLQKTREAVRPERSPQNTRASRPAPIGPRIRDAGAAQPGFPRHHVSPLNCLRQFRLESGELDLPLRPKF